MNSSKNEPGCAPSASRPKNRSGLYAHTPNQKGDWHELLEHLQGVANRARRFGDKFGAGDLAERAGWLHDAGKANPDFQRYLIACHSQPESKQKGPPHSILGALEAHRQRADILSLVIAGHHGGLPDLSTFKTQRLKPADTDPRIEDLLESLRPLRLPRSPVPVPNSTALEAEFLIRMLFSSLVDADFLDTEAHMSEGISEKRSRAPSLQSCWEALEAYQKVNSGHAKDPLNQARHEIYLACVSAAESPQGFFRLTVPTGGGKTLSGMAFALRHCMTSGLDRVIVAIPYTSIVDQNAGAYRSILGEEAVLEHHSNADWRNQTDPEDAPESTIRQRLASENWDAPIVVTTTIQFFESLFSNRVSACRKLHNIAKSVVILDEVQMIPEGLLDPILDVLKEMVARYHVTVVFSSATQPSFQFLHNSIGNAKEIVPDPGRFFRSLQRVRYERPPSSWTWEQLAAEVRQHPRAMAVLNRKRDALATLDALADPEAYHLSTLLYPAHRRRILKELREKLERREPCRLIATQVVEAGVDLDFPVVFRAVGPLDRIVQAAGRCNREGGLGTEGRVIVFTPSEGGVPHGTYAAGMSNALGLLADPCADLNDPALYDRYFVRLYQTVSTDAKHIQERRKELDFPAVTERFRMIESPTVPVLVRKALCDEERALIEDALERLRNRWGSPRSAMRMLQPFIVSLFQQDVACALTQGLAVPLESGLFEWVGKYHSRRGLSWDVPDPADLII